LNAINDIENGLNNIGRCGRGEWGTIEKRRVYRKEGIGVVEEG
jgi:hypothetical protein